MANKKISELDSRASMSLSDLLAVGDPSTGYLYKTTISDLKALTGAGVISFNGRYGAVVPAEGDYTLTQLADVIITSPSNNQVVRYNGSNWVNATLDLTTTLAALTDVAITSIANGQLLKYNSTSGKWENWTPNYLTAEADTLDSVTGRGATTTNSITTGNLTAYTTGSITSLLLKAGSGGSTQGYIFIGTSGYGSSYGQNKMVFQAYQNIDGFSFTANDGTIWASIKAGTQYFAGNVLVGTTTDSGHKLNVSGTIKVSGDFTFGGTQNYFTNTNPYIFYNRASTAGITFAPANVIDNANNNSVVIMDTGYGNIAYTTGTYISNALSILQGINVGSGYTGTIRGFYYNPTITSIGGATHYAFESTAGKVKVSDLSGTGSRLVVADANGVLSASTALSSLATDSAVVHLAGTETISGAKTMSSSITADAGIFIKHGTQLGATGYIGLGADLNTLYISNGFQNALTFTSTAARTFTFPNASGTMALTSDIPTLSSLSGVPTSRTITINGTTYDLSANRSWTISTYTLPVATSTVLGGVKIGSGVSVDVNGVISVSTSYQAPLSGTGFVKISGTTISYDNSTYLTGITSTQVTTALGYTPYNSTNPSGYITGINSTMVTTALGYTPYNSSNPNGYITAGGTLTGYVSTANGDFAIVNTTSGTGASWVGRTGVKNAGADKSVFLGTYNSLAIVGAHNNALTAWADLYVNTVDGSSGGNVRLPSSTYVSGNQVIHAGNIGSYTAGAANSVAWGNVSSKPGNLTYWDSWYGSAYLGSDGNLYMGWAGTWLSYWLNQSVKTDASPTFANIYASSLMRAYGTFNAASWAYFDGNVQFSGGNTQYYQTNTAYNWRDWGGWGGYWWSRNGGDMIMNLYAMYAVTGGISDIRYKKDIESLPYGLKEVMQLNPIKFHYDLPKESMLANDPDYFLGFSAQEVQGLIPEAVHEKINEDTESMKGMLAITYDELIPVVVQAIKEQQGLILNNTAEIESLKQSLSKLLNK